MKRRERMEECQVIKETEEERGNKREDGGGPIQRFGNATVYFSTIDRRHRMLPIMDEGNGYSTKGRRGWMYHKTARVLSGWVLKQMVRK